MVAIVTTPGHLCRVLALASCVLPCFATDIGCAKIREIYTLRKAWKAWWRESGSGQARRAPARPRLRAGNRLLEAEAAGSRWLAGLRGTAARRRRSLNRDVRVDRYAGKADEGSRRIHPPNGQVNVNVRTIDDVGALT